MSSNEQISKGLGVYLDDVEAAAKDIEECDLVNRIWHKDFTVWSDSPVEITNRLGWLSVTNLMREELDAMRVFSKEIKASGIKHVVLLGMGGSSLGPEVLAQTFGSITGFPGLIVLDSTVPARIQAVTNKINPAHTLFLVSSKSGGTIEPLSLELYFRELVAKAVGTEKVSRYFVTITDPGTQLAVRAGAGEFRHAFINTPAIGGRYSVLSFFGLIPAVLMGVDIAVLLDQADRMRGECAATDYAHENPGAWLGVVLGALAQAGRDKLTIVTSPTLSSFGLWVEQLIAESLGKNGKGIVPVVGEPIVDIGCYSNDRLFVYLRLDDDNNTASDELMEKLGDNDQPVLVLELGSKYDLGAEFYRWEFATAVAGAVLGIHPFDQPNVQQAKEATDIVLKEYMTCGQLPGIGKFGSLKNILQGAVERSYIAALAYINESHLVDKLIGNFRRTVVEHYRLPTTFGYGPRYLHSTGQLHKGGPNTGCFLMITTTHPQDIPVPGKPYTFGVLADAQALGDLRTLQSLGRRVMNIQFDGTDQLAVSQLINEIGNL